jgi:hypothetical protein
MDDEEGWETNLGWWIVARTAVGFSSSCARACKTCATFAAECKTTYLRLPYGTESGGMRLFIGIENGFGEMETSSEEERFKDG